MSSSESDVSWETLGRIVREWAGSSARLAEVRHFDGGSVSDTLGLVLEDGGKAVLKISPHRVDRHVVSEAQQLAHLRLLGVPVPTVYRFRMADLDWPDSYLLMEWVEGVDLAKVKEQASAVEFDAIQRELAEIVLKMHGQTGPGYMRVGADDCECGSWPAFFEGVYGPIWAELEKDPATSKATKKAFNKIRSAVPTLLEHGDRPRLTHWDLWCGNVLANRNGSGWKVTGILDPMCKYAHHEAELAYLEMFGTVTRAFLEVYKSVLRPADEYARSRRQVYQCYFAMDHAAFFGGSYHAKFAAAVEKTAALV